MKYTLILEGIAMGLGLAILTGPLFFILLEASITKGSRAATKIASGIWTSDVIIAGVSIFFIDKVRVFVKMDGFEAYLGGLGGIILIALGIGSYFAKKPKENTDSPKDKSVKSGFFMNWLKGFIVNTANPFTFFFWMTVTTSYYIGKKISLWELVVLHSTIILVIVISDLCKVHFAKYLRKFIKTDYQKIGKILGIVLCIFGVVLILRTLAF